MPRDASAPPLASDPLRSRIAAARFVLWLAEMSGHWGAVDIAHERLLQLELEEWLGGGNA
jgi:hypothetical protein